MTAGRVSFTAQHMVDLLRAHYIAPNRPPGGLFATEIEAPHGQRRADAVWMPTTATAGASIVGHEVKVSRADVLVELADPTKADAWARHCDRWWLVVSSPELVDGLDIPERWGIMAPPSGRNRRTMTTIRPAPTLHPESQALAFRRLAAWTNARWLDAATRAEHEAGYLRRDVDKLTRELRAVEAGRLARTDPKAAQLAELLAALESAARDTYSPPPPTADLVAAVTDLASLRTTIRDARSELERTLRALAEPFGYASSRVREQIDALTAARSGLASPPP